ncbi:hypothetical protein [Streptomyces tsukubensis]|uniref:Uncharacterized protein n=1 Tax=Streptomyces tsukubensis TaxID=83656 RepID=A0A1V4A174_9ACTN|nr:hypothetical protein [Streptomyces tsukubensis]OON72451.1 hypothetical protein B1H18_29925 [Streptomyces tsukubensis]QFR96981.1 hypothetical protein GBW32_32945 [Streptomyces tsukubensis]
MDPTGLDTNGNPCWFTAEHPGGPHSSVADGSLGSRPDGSGPSVLDAEHRQVRILPNPFSERGRGINREKGGVLRSAYRL